MAFSDSNRASLRILQESNSAWGVTPASGLARALRFTSSSLVAMKDTTVSNEIRFDRMVSSVVETAANSEGDIDYEFSAGSHDILMQAFLLGQWSRPMEFDKFQGINVSWATTSRLDISGADYTAYFTAGRRVVTGGYLNPENNSYFEVQSVAFASGATQVTMTTSTAVVEAGNAKSFIQDANDIVILKSTSIRAATAGAASFDSNGTNAFASAITAGQLVVGQNIQVDGFGYETGSFDLTATNPTDGEFVTVNDGVDSLSFEFDNNAAVTAGRISVTIGGSAAASATNLAAAINQARLDGRLAVSATVATTVVTIRNKNKTGGSLAETSANITITAFSGGNLVSAQYKIVSLTDDIIGVSPTPPATITNGVAVTIKGSMVRNPSGVGSLPHQAIVPQSFTIETAFNDITAFLVQDGMRVGEFSMTVEAGEIVNGTYSFMGKETKKRVTTLIGTSPYTPLQTTSTEVMNATTNVGAIKKDGATLSTAIQSIELEGDASLRVQSAVGSKFPRGIGTGRFTLEGTLTAYFENLDLYTEFLEHETVSLEFYFSDIDGNQYTYTLPALKFSSDEPAPEGIDEDVMEELEFTAFRDSATGCMLQIDRFSTSSSVTA